MSFPSILGGFETYQKQFFEIFEAKGKNRTKEISVEISYRSPPISDISTEISEILFPCCMEVFLHPFS